MTRRRMELRSAPQTCASCRRQRRPDVAAGLEPPQPAAPAPGEATVTHLAPRLNTASGFGPAGAGNGATGNGLGNGLGQGGRPRYERPAAALPAVPEPKVAEWEASQPRETQPREAQPRESQPRETPPREAQARDPRPESHCRRRTSRASPSGASPRGPGPPPAARRLPLRRLPLSPGRRQPRRARHLSRRPRVSRRRAKAGRQRAVGGPRYRPGTRSCSATRASGTSPAVLALDRVTTPCRTHWIRGFMASERTGSGVSWRQSARCRDRPARAGRTGPPRAGRRAARGPRGMRRSPRPGARRRTARIIQRVGSPYAS